MSAHDHVRFPAQFGKWHKMCPFQFVKRGIDPRQTGVTVDICITVTGEMLDAGDDVFVLHAFDICGRH
jgi:hypothetical protein